MKKSHVASGRARAAASVLTLSFVAVVTGAVPVAGLAFEPRLRPAPPVTPVALVPAVVTAPVIEPTTDPSEPLGPPDPAARPSDHVQVGPVQLTATLGRAKLLRADAPQVVELVCAVGVARTDTPERRPVDLAVVVDTSASMSGVIGLVKRATLGVIERLGDGDRLVLVGYADEARVLFQGPVTPASRAQLEGVVARLVAARGTNIEAGLAVGRAALAALEGRASEQKLLLLSDGAPTIGATDPRELEAGAVAVRKAGVTLSSIGLGPSYREALLASMADAGGGAFHHVAEPRALPRVYAAELDALRAVALRDARLSIRPAPGVDVLSVAAWTAKDAEGASVVSLGDLSSGSALKVVVRLRVPTGSASARDVASVRLVGAGEAGQVALETASLSAGLTDDAAAADASRVAEVEGDLRQASVADCLRRAHEAAEREDGDGARALVREARALCGSDLLTFTTPSGEEQRVSLDALADELAEGAATDRGQRAMKTTIAAERAAGRAR